MGTAETIAGVVASFVVGGGVQAVLQAISNYRLAKTAQPVEQYAALVTKLETRIEKLEADHATCTAGQVKAAEEIGELRGKISVLMNTISGKSENQIPE